MQIKSITRGWKFAWLPFKTYGRWIWGWYQYCHVEVVNNAI